MYSVRDLKRFVLGFVAIWGPEHLCVSESWKPKTECCVFLVFLRSTQERTGRNFCSSLEITFVCCTFYSTRSEMSVYPIFVSQTCLRLFVQILFHCVNQFCVQDYETEETLERRNVRLRDWLLFELCGSTDTVEWECYCLTVSSFASFCWKDSHHCWVDLVLSTFQLFTLVSVWNRYPVDALSFPCHEIL